MGRPKKEDSHINPKHYRVGGIELIDVMVAKMSPEEIKGFCKGLALKYLFRADYKNGLEDYKKAQWYINYLIEFLEKEAKKKEKEAKKAAKLQGGNDNASS